MAIASIAVREGWRRWTVDGEGITVEVVQFMFKPCPAGDPWQWIMGSRSAEKVCVENKWAEM
jgi:hypothetical protein